MGAVKQTVSALVRMLDQKQRQAKRLPVTLDKLEKYLTEKPKEVINFSLFLLLIRIEGEATKRNRDTVKVLIPPDLMVSVDDVNSDSWLEQLKSRGFTILTLEQFGGFIKSLKSEVTQGNYMPAIEFLRANAFLQRASLYPARSARKAEKPPQPSAPSGWKASDFLPALPPHPPLPRGLFRD